MIFASILMDWWGRLHGMLWETAARCVVGAVPILFSGTWQDAGTGEWRAADNGVGH